MPAEGAAGLPRPAQVSDETLLTSGMELCFNLGMTNSSASIPTTDQIADAASRIGTEHGRSAATWVEIGSAEQARRILEGIEEGDPEILDAIPNSDLSGEWADGYTVLLLLADISSELGVDALAEEGSDEEQWIIDDAARAYEEAFFSAAEEEIERMCRAMLPTAADVLADAGFTGYRFEGFDFRADRPADLPEGGETASLSDFEMTGAPTHFEMPVTLWGDYCGSDFGRSNHRSLLRDFPGVFVDARDAYSAHFLLIPATVSTELAEKLARIGRGLAESYPLYDEEDHSALESEMAEEAWESYLEADLRRALCDAITQRIADRDANYGRESSEAASDVVDAIDDADLRERFYTVNGEMPQPYYLESADSVVFPHFDDVVGILACHYGAHDFGALEESRFAGTVHRKCQHCDVISALDDDDEE